MFENTKNNEKDGGDGLFFKKTYKELFTLMTSQEFIFCSMNDIINDDDVVKTTFGSRQRHSEPSMSMAVA